MRALRARGVLVAYLLCISACATTSHPTTPATHPGSVLETREGFASYYGTGFNGKVAANGRPFDNNAMVAAHPSYPFGTLVRVTNLGNGRSVRVRIVDRGPASGPRSTGVIIDVSRRAAQSLGLIDDGRARVRIDVLRWGE